MDKFSTPSRFGENQGNIWKESAHLISNYKPIDLGRGYPNFLPPQTVLGAFTEVTNSTDYSVYQYCRNEGHTRLVLAISKLYSKLIFRDINPYTEILITFGAYNAIFASLMGHVENGDEVIIIEPFYDAFERNVLCAGGIPKFVPLRLKEDVENPTSRDWILDLQEMEILFNEKTKAIILNTPHNPTGKVFTVEEMEFIAKLCKKWNVLCISDDTYEFLVYEPKSHIRMATLPDMWERTLTIGSIGKIFGATGIKLGFIYGPSKLIANAQLAHMTCGKVNSTFLQEVAAICFEKEINRLDEEGCYFHSHMKECQVKRDFMSKALRDVGVRTTVPEGGYFVVADWSLQKDCYNIPDDKRKYKEYNVIKFMSKDVGILGIPLTVFYSEDHRYLGQNLVRYCFDKTEDLLKKAEEALQKWKGYNCE